MKPMNTSMEENYLRNNLGLAVKKCAVCHRPNEQILLLACEHDSCIRCSALHYFEGAPIQSDIKRK